MRNTIRNYESYLPPLLSLLDKADPPEEDGLEQKETASKIQDTLLSFGVKATITDINRGPVYTRYELEPAAGVRVRTIANLLDEIRIQIAAKEISMEAPIPGKSAIGIDVLNDTRTLVHLRELLESREFCCHEGELPFVVGRETGGRNVIYDLVRTPHLLLSGATGSGKSMFIHTTILSLLYRNSPEKVRFLMIDPEMIELPLYNGIPHLIIPVVSDVRKSSAALGWAVAEMEKRVRAFAAAGVHDLAGFNSLAVHSPSQDGRRKYDPFPRLVIIINELADLMLRDSREVEEAICRLAIYGRITGIHLIISTQQPSADVVTGLIRSNMRSRIAFAVTSQIHSKMILDRAGAEKLTGYGDMLFFPHDYLKPVHIQGAYVSRTEVRRVVDYLISHPKVYKHDDDLNSSADRICRGGGLERENADVNEDGGRDEYFAEAGRFIIEKNKASIGLLQRVFEIGFNRAAKIMDQLAEAGVVSEESSTRARQVLMTMAEFEQFLEEEL